MKDLLDEDGRCWKTDLLPETCGCARHRGGESVEEEAAVVPYKDYLIHRFIASRFHGQCKLVPSHYIEVGDDIGLAVEEQDISKPLGWVCTACVNNITG